MDAAKGVDSIRPFLALLNNDQFPWPAAADPIAPLSIFGPRFGVLLVSDNDEPVVTPQGKPLLIIAEDVEGEALAAIWDRPIEALASLRIGFAGLSGPVSIQPGEEPGEVTYTDGSNSYTVIWSAPDANGGEPKPLDAAAVVAAFEKGNGTKRLFDKGDLAERGFYTNMDGDDRPNIIDVTEAVSVEAGGGSDLVFLAALDAEVKGGDGNDLIRHELQHVIQQDGPVDLAPIRIDGEAGADLYIVVNDEAPVGAVRPVTVLGWDFKQKEGISGDSLWLPQFTVETEILPGPDGTLIFKDPSNGQSVVIRFEAGGLGGEPVTDAALLQGRILLDSDFNEASDTSFAPLLAVADDQAMIGNSNDADTFVFSAGIDCSTAIDIERVEVDDTKVSDLLGLAQVWASLGNDSGADGIDATYQSDDGDMF